MNPLVAVLGSLNMDLLVVTDRLPAPGETVLGRDFVTLPGGKGGNQAVAAARAGARVRMIGAVGDDAFGPELRAGLVAEGIDVANVETVPGPSGVALIAVEPGGENIIVVASGANVRFTPTADALEHAAVVLGVLEVPVTVIEETFARARQLGIVTVLNAAPAQTLPPAVLALVDVLVVNEHELAAQSGAEAIVPTIVTTLGARGARLVHHGRVHEVAAHRVTPVDTVGAGDAFTGAFAAAVAQGRPLPEALARANAAGALTTLARGARTSPTATAIDAVLAG